MLLEVTCGGDHQTPDCDGVHEQEEAVQVRGAVLPRGAHGGAFCVGRAVRQTETSGRRELPGSLQPVSIVKVPDSCCTIDQNK